MSYTPIENYGLIGNMHSAALASLEGSIDWFCFPRFDSPSIFAAILDKKKGGYFKIAPVATEVKKRQFYLPETNILLTRFLSEEGVAEIRDFMPILNSHSRATDHGLVREVRGIRGKIKMKMHCEVAFDYARQKSEVWVHNGFAVFASPSLSMGLISNIPLKKIGKGVGVEFTLEEGQILFFVLREVKSEEKIIPSFEEILRLGQETADYWHRWISKCTYHGRWREQVTRSALALKLLTYEPTGAVIAAPTAGLPESLGGERNWDYRYTWVRDAAFTTFAFLRIGFIEETTHFIEWLDRLCRREGKRSNKESPLRVLYNLDGETPPPEEILGHLEGYAGSRPVRVGNAAMDQLQLDIYGPLLDAVYLFSRQKNAISNQFWEDLVGYLEWIGKNWRRQDSGIWEVRGKTREFLYSKLMCWVAMDRGLRLSQLHSYPAPFADWQKTRDEIYRQIFQRGWNESVQAFVDYYGSSKLDASNFLLPIMQLVSPSDPRWEKTLKAMRRPPEQGGLVSNALVYRYLKDEKLDSFKSREGTFNICTFWYIEALVRSGRIDPKFLSEARWVFEHILGFANHLGLFSEEIGPRGEFLGNFPQAFSHLALITSAYNLNRIMDRQGIKY